MDTENIQKKDELNSPGCTFEVTVRFTQNSTWQGQILWADKNIKQNFRSVLEMLSLMDEALTEEKPKAVGWGTK